MRAVLFDLDGVLVSTEPLKGEAHASTVKSFGGNVSASFYSEVMGRSHEEVRTSFLQAAKIDINPEIYDQIFFEIYREALRTKLELAPGAFDLLQKLTEKQYLLAVVTSSDSQLLNQILKACDIFRFFKVRISEGDIQKKKPAPDAYLLALNLLSVSAKSAVVLEDSESGVLAAINAGIPVIAIRHHINKNHSFAGASAILNSLAETQSIIRIINRLTIDS